MQYTDFKGIKLSKLAFGTMRLPVDENKTIIEDQVFEMVDYALSNGINYFDTAWPYHGGNSERVIGKALARHPRESFYLATKFPGHMTAESYDPKAIFEAQLEKCRVDYFDFYLLHNICESSLPVYLDERWGIIDYFLEQRRLGKIKHLGFSTHGRLDNMKEFLGLYGKEMEFCQIQLNYLDWTLQQANEKYDLLKQHNIPIWVMEPVRGGRLLKLPQGVKDKLNDLRPTESLASWAFRYLDTLDVAVVLSGMSNMEQMQDNIKTYSGGTPLSESEVALLYDIAESMKDSLPCTGCGYCLENCPMQLDIPTILSYYNEMRFANSFTVDMGIESMPKEKQPISCIGCGNCQKVCPQKIDIPKAMRDFANELSKYPTWAQVCEQRAKEQV